MRTVKEAAVRRNEILDAAERLFGTKGFDQTSTNDLLAEVGIARGTLYYHFKSKEEILDAMIERISNRLLSKAKAIANDQSLPILVRLTRMMQAMNVSDPVGLEIVEQVHQPQNALLHQKMQEHLVSGLTPLVTKVVKEANAQGICQTDYPKQTVEMLLIYTTSAFDNLMEVSEQERITQIQALIYNLERLFGTKPGVMAEVILPIFTQNSTASDGFPDPNGEDGKD